MTLKISNGRKCFSGHEALPLMFSGATTGLVSRCVGDRRKEEVLTEGGLHNHVWLCEEVSRSHSTWGNELPLERYRTHKQGRTERKLVLNFQRNSASYSPEKAEQEELNVKQQA